MKKYLLRMTAVWVEDTRGVIQVVNQSNKTLPVYDIGTPDLVGIILMHATILRRATPIT